ncbi:MAG: hypothetical protein HY861_03465 [Chlamydiia bacterium]|nr:hypothetical protein [Chlamydiia bacterium]
MTLRISNASKEGIYQGSKWLKFQVLCDEQELRALFQALHPFFLFPLTGMGSGKAFAEEDFLQEYGSWIAGLREGRVPTDGQLRRILAAAITDDLESLWLQEIEGKGFITKIGKPVVQMQAHFFSYSDVDEVLRPMSMGLESVFWGVQFSYPQIYQDAKTMELRNVERGRLFEQVRLWVREFTRATPFIVGKKKINAPIRLGKACFSWIQLHPQLIQRSLGVYAL